MNKYFVFWMAIMVGVAVITGGAVNFADAGEMYVITNKAVPDSSLSQAELKNIFLGKKVRWADNQRIDCVAQKDTPCHESFLQNYVQKNPFQFNNYWKKQIFTGKGQPPRTFATEQELIDYVSRTSGAIGYSCTRPDAGRVNILSVN